MHFDKRDSNGGKGDCLGVFEGEFYSNTKHGPCKFVLFKNNETLGIFTGEFVHNLEKFSSSNYGKRFWRKEGNFFIIAVSFL